MYSVKHSPYKTTAKEGSMMKRSKISIFLVLLLFAPLATLANELNEIKMKNGDRLSGKIISQDEESVVIETPYAGPMKIDSKHIDSISLLTKGESTVAKVKQTMSRRMKSRFRRRSRK